MCSAATASEDGTSKHSLGFGCMQPCLHGPAGAARAAAQGWPAAPQKGARNWLTKLRAAAADPAPVAAETKQDRLAEYVAAKGGTSVIRRVLIANNGMAATKSIMSMRRWAYLELGDEHPRLEFIVMARAASENLSMACRGASRAPRRVMATPEDLNANAEFVRLADEYVEVPGGSNTNNYANVKLIVDTASRLGVDAVWPGWGHASENPKLPRALKEKGIAFMGPPAPVMSVLGDKIAANILAQTAKVPSIPLERVVRQPRRRRAAPGELAGGRDHPSRDVRGRVCALVPKKL